MKRLISLTALAVALGCGAADAQYTDGTIKIGVMNDMSGTYSDLSGQGSVVVAVGNRAASRRVTIKRTAKKLTIR